MKNRISLKTISPLAGLAILVTSFAGCGESSVADSQPPQQRVYFDLKSKKAVVAPSSSDVPVAHPKTGKRTLMPALYCSNCKRWYPAPPLEVRQRNPAAGKCPKCKQPLIADGPMPSE